MRHPSPVLLPPDFVVIGHLTRDERPAGYDLGGTATYAAITARNLGYHAGILTRAAEDFPQRDLLHDIEIKRLVSDRITTFRNIYDEHGRRHQFVHDVAQPVDASELPAAWGEAKIALLGPIAREVETLTVRRFGAQTLIGVVPQGWLRQWDDNGLVSVRAWEEAPDILPYARVLVLSEEDLGELAPQVNSEIIRGPIEGSGSRKWSGVAGRLEIYVQLTRIVVLTRGARGCTVFRKGHEPFDSPAFRANEFDPTGAGDVFTAAFLIRLYETDDVVHSARFANCVASFAVEAEGVTGIPTRAMVEARLSEG